MVANKSLVLASLSLFSGAAFSQACKGNSCLIADVSGSTGRIFDGAQMSKIPEVTVDGRKCIEKAYVELNLPVPPNYTPLISMPANYNPRTDWYARRAKPRSLRRTLSEPQPEKREANDEYEQNVESTLEPRQAGCKPKTLIWARGTLDPPMNNNIGVILGPNVQSGLESAQPGQWNTVGIEYSADFNGIYCVGMPGGLSCKNKLNQLAKQCPQTKFIVAGYSQGAMISHECVAFADKEARDRVAGVVVFGDPFNGAPIRDYPSSKVKTFCDATDGVCAGHLDIGLGHFAYSAGDSATQAVRWILTQI